MSDSMAFTSALSSILATLTLRYDYHAISALRTPYFGLDTQFRGSGGDRGRDPIGCSLTPIAVGGTSAWAHNSAVECVLHTDEVAGSNPAAPTQRRIA